MTTLYSFRNADISIGAKTILNHINWTIKSGDHTWITGENASGKTTLCRALSGRCRIISGWGGPVDIGYEDIKMVSFTDDGKLFHSVNNVHYYQQRFNAWDADGHLTASDYLKAQGIDPSLKKHEEFIDKIGLTNLLNVERIKLSSGQTRKLLLASALLHSPKLLVLDNPYIGLDSESRNYLNLFLENLMSQNVTTLILSGHVSVLPGSIKYKMKLENEQITRHVDAQYDDPTRDKNCKITLNRILHLYRPIKLENQPDRILNLENVTVRYGNNAVLEKLNWKVKKGEKWGLLGPNGSGKSTLVSLIYADHPQVYSQKIEILGSRAGPGRTIWDIKKNIGFTSPELHAYFRTDLSAQEVTWTGLFDKFEITGLMNPSSKNLSDQLFSYYGLDHIKDQDYSRLSTGHQRICLFLRALIKRPVLLLLDEPFQGLDKRNVALSKLLLDHIIGEDQSLIFISHFQHEIPGCVTKFFNLSN